MKPGTDNREVCSFLRNKGFSYNKKISVIVLRIANHPSTAPPTNGGSAQDGSQ
jgi:hypothetical protein